MQDAAISVAVNDEVGAALGDADRTSDVVQLVFPGLVRHVIARTRIDAAAAIISSGLTR
jgi:hypothetical protein